MTVENKPLKVRVVLGGRGWIFEKFAVRLVENLREFSVTAELSDKPSPDVDVNHWIGYNEVDRNQFALNTVLVTHIDRPLKYPIMKARLMAADLGICLSRMTMQDLIHYGINREKLCFITPGQDGLVKPKRIVIGITSRVRHDKAKREYLLVELARKMNLDSFHFKIIGKGWENVISSLEAAGATVEYFPGTNSYENDYKVNLEQISQFDYYLYLGLDDGSMGFLDALAAGIPTIVTPQGFHLDVNGGITYSFIEKEELQDIFTKLARERERLIESVSGLTWIEYARQHAIAWRGLVDGKQAEISSLLHSNHIFDIPIEKCILPKHFNDFKIYLKIPYCFYSDLVLLIDQVTCRNAIITFVLDKLRDVKHRLFTDNR